MRTLSGPCHRSRRARLPFSFRSANRQTPAARHPHDTLVAKPGASRHVSPSISVFARSAKSASRRTSSQHLPAPARPKDGRELRAHAAEPVSFNPAACRTGGYAQPAPEAQAPIAGAERRRLIRIEASNHPLHRPAALAWPALALCRPGAVLRWRPLSWHCAGRRRLRRDGGRLRAGGVNVGRNRGRSAMHPQRPAGRPGAASCVS